MIIRYSIGLYALSHLVILWTLFRRRFIPDKATVFLSVLIFSASAISFFLNNNYSIFYIYLFYVIEYLVLRYYLTNWLLPSFLIILQDMIVTVVRLVTLYIPAFFLSNSMFSNSHLLISIATIQCILLLGISILLKRLDKKYVVVPLINELKQRYIFQGIILLFFFFFLLTSHLYLYLKEYDVTFLALIFLTLLFSLMLLIIMLLIKKMNQNKSFLRSLYLSMEEERRNYELAREYRHDFHSVLLGLNEYLCTITYRVQKLI